MYHIISLHYVYYLMFLSIWMMETQYSGWLLLVQIHNLCTVDCRPPLLNPIYGVDLSLPSGCSFFSSWVPIVAPYQWPMLKVVGCAPASPIHHCPAHLPTRSGGRHTMGGCEDAYRSTSHVLHAGVFSGSPGSWHFAHQHTFKFGSYNLCIFVF